MNLVATAPGDGLARGVAYYQQGAYVQAYTCLLPLAEKGHGHAQCLVGGILALEAGGVRRNLTNAVKWLDIGTRALHMRDTGGMNKVYDELMQKLDWRIIGEGRFRAFKWQQAFLNAEYGDPPQASPDCLIGLETMSVDEAIHLGAALNEGDDGPLDYEKAFLCFRRAAVFNHPGAVFNVGLSYYIGKGVRGDVSKAIPWLARAADLGYAKAALMLAIMTVRGHGVPADLEAAQIHFARATELGDPDAALMAQAVAEGSPLF